MYITFILAPAWDWTLDAEAEEWCRTWLDVHSSNAAAGWLQKYGHWHWNKM